MMLNKGILLVSLDFELHWGVRDLYTLDSVKQNLERARSFVKSTLQQFENHGVHATWTTVGFLFSRDRDELLDSIPAIQPGYHCPGLSPYPDIQKIGRDETEDPYHFAPSLVEEILRTPGQEVGTHTFSHYYCLESGQTKEMFRSDLAAAVYIANKRNVALRSFVFPRNQVNPEYLDLLPEFGIQSYRGCEKSWLYRPRPRGVESAFRRAVRLLDAYVNLSGHHTFSLKDTGVGPPFNFPSSRLLRKYLPGVGFLEPLRIARICSGLDHAARHRRIYHLWFHPEELAENPEKSAKVLKKILERFTALRDRGEMESLTMGELAARLTTHGCHGTAATCKASGSATSRNFILNYGD